MKARIFISYSRRNKDFTQRLVNELKARGYDPWVDFDDIPFSADWWNEIREAINDHDVVITVVSNPSLTSRVVNQEIKYARDNNKRIIPLIVEKVDIKWVVGELYDKPYEMDARDNYRYIRTLNWIYFYRPEDDFMKGVDGIITATELDHDYLREHTRLLNRAQEWNDNRRSQGFLLMGEELADAELWLSRAEDSRRTPPPTRLHHEYIQESRTHEEELEAQLEAMRRQTRRLRSATIGLIITAVIVISLVLLALQQQQRRSRAAEQSLLTVQLQGTAILETQAAVQNSIFQSGTESASTEIAVRNGILQQSTEGAQTQQAVQDGIVQRSTEGAQTQQAVQDGIVQRSTEGAVTQQAVQQEIFRQSTEGAATQQTIIADIEIQRQRSEALRLASEAENALENGDPNQLAIPLAIAAERAVEDGTPPERIGRILANAAFQPGLVRFFETEDERTAHENTISAVAFSPDGRIIASASQDRTVRLWNAGDGTLIQTLEGHRGRVLSVAFSADGSLLATGDAEAVIIIREVNTGTELLRLEEHTERINDLAFSPDNTQLISVSSDTNVIVWDAQTGERLRTLGSHGNRVTEVAYNPDGTSFITGDATGQIFIWDANTSFFLRQENRHAGAITGIAYSPEGNLVLTSSNDGRFILWRDFENGERRVDDILTGIELTGINFATEDTALIATVNGDLIMWDLTVPANENGEIRRLLLPGQTSPITTFEVNTTQRFAAIAYENRRMSLWEIENGAVIQRVKVQELPISSLASTNAGQIVFRYIDGQIVIWNPEHTRTTTSDTELGLTGVSILPDANSALGQLPDTGELARVNFESAEIEQTYDLPILATGTRYSPDGTMALSRVVPGTDSISSVPGSVSTTNRLLWEIESGEIIFLLPSVGFTFSESSEHFALNADHTELAAVNQETEILVFDIESGEIINTYSRDRTVTSLTYTPDGGLLVGYADGGIALRRNEETTWRDLRGHTAPVLSITTSPDQQFILSGSQDGTVVVWDIGFSEAVRQFETDTRGINGIIFNGGASTFTTRSIDGSVVLWRFDRTVDEIIDWTLANRFIRTFSATDCVAFQIPEPCG